MRVRAFVFAAVTAAGLVAGSVGTGAASPQDYGPDAGSPYAISDQPVPDVRGERPNAARAIMEEAGFRTDFIGGTSRGPNGGQCVVGDQTPAPGNPAPVGSTVALRTAEVGESPQPC
ncbi:PASTA domain-containing protein [Nocardia bovistercoris]|uniref:PASTA domain-containing protein n=1 Tax=Nocardia bovistercoris TaxID=2785916 RepID=A0A931N474_9NOCA|nr:PASTA domain-containing protein [Nocardia bovistercoris]MBH0778432.1 PASTA domain-containing protein [Nocardia bovistercoris]